MKIASVLAVAAALMASGSAAAATPVAHGQLIHVRANTNQSSNWFGYNQGSLEQGGKLFTSITGDWTVPTVSAHTAGQGEDSSDWIGIGGGCVDAGCTVTDSTLIQTGTEQDVSGGVASYSAWWELVPAPSISISMTVGPGDHLTSSEQMQLIDSNSNVIGTASAPDSDADGFNACTWATSCAAPSGS